jgi:hypothetical protein
MDYCLAISQAIINQFIQSNILDQINTNTFLSFYHSGVNQCAVFEGNRLQPRFLDRHHFYAALGSGKLSADPFLRFVVDVFCRNIQPTVRDAVFLATWTVQHVIETNPGGVAGPIRIVTMIADGQFGQAKELSNQEIQEHYRRSRARAKHCGIGGTVLQTAQPRSMLICRLQLTSLG